MSMIYKRSIPLGIASFLCLFLFVSFFIENPVLSAIETRLLGWGIIVIAISLMVGLVNILKHHIVHVSKQTPGQWLYSLTLIISVVVFLLVAVFFGTMHEYTQTLYLGIPRALSSAMHSLNLFYISWAAYRTFRFRTVDSSVLMCVAVLTMISMVPIGRVVWSGFPVIGDFLSLVVNKAGARAIAIGVGLGIVVQGIRLIRGRERGFLGPAEE
ncbi:hypothetical protein ES703_99375 [subsurface metagenome]